MLADAGITLQHWTPLHVHLGTTHQVAHVALLDGDVLPAGYTARVQLVFDKPVCALPGDRFIVRADLPGLKKEDVQVELGENALTIHGERNEQRDDERDGYYHSERQYGEFYRTIPLPEGVIGDSAQASFRDGVLEITMQAPPAEASRGRRLEIQEAPQSGDKK